jgi:large subunit ribosomal protein L13e
VIKVVRFITPTVERGNRVREGKGFSLKELEVVELSAGKAKTMGIPVDTRRKSSHDENIAILKKFLEDVKDLDLKVSKPKFENKPIPGRVFRGKTSSGKKMRNLSRRK